MTRFEKDVKEIQEGNEIEVLKRRKAELEDSEEKADAKRTDLKDSALHRSMKEKWQSTKN